MFTTGRSLDDLCEVEYLHLTYISVVHEDRRNTENWYILRAWGV